MLPLHWPKKYEQGFKLTSRQKCAVQTLFQRQQAFCEKGMARFLQATTQHSQSDRWGEVNRTCPSQLQLKITHWTCLMKNNPTFGLWGSQLVSIFPTECVWISSLPVAKPLKIHSAVRMQAQKNNLLEDFPRLDSWANFFGNSPHFKYLQKMSLQLDRVLICGVKGPAL